MTHSQESRVSSSQDTFRLCEEISSVSVLVNRLNSCLALSTDVVDEQDRAEKMAASSSQEEKKTENLFPWMSGFEELCRSSVGSKSMKQLEHLLTVYLRNVSANVKDCYLKPNRAAKLKKCMSDALVYFHLFYQDIREPMEHSSYLDKMTELVSMYLDMEIKASRRRKESLKKVACRLTSSLYLLLDQSEDHILDSILRAKLINKHYRDICNPVLGKVLNQVQASPLYDLLYVRYLLVYKVWKKVVGDAEDRKRINKLAIQKLTPPPNFVDKISMYNTVLPKIPKSKKNITLFYMQAKFNLKNALTAFLKTCKDSQQPDFIHNLSVNMDNSLFFSDRLTDSSPRLGHKSDDVDGGGSNRLINDIWSSMNNADSGLTDSSQLKGMTANSSKPDHPSGKMKNKEKKNKKKTKQVRDTTKTAIKGKKKKKGKKKCGMGLGDTVSAIGSVTPGGISMLKKASKVKKKKKKKAQMAVEVQSPCTPCAVIKNESVCSLADSPSPTSVSPPPNCLTAVVTLATTVTPVAVPTRASVVSTPTVVPTSAVVRTPAVVTTPAFVTIPAGVRTPAMLASTVIPSSPVVYTQTMLPTPAMIPTSVMEDVRLVEIKVEANLECEAQSRLASGACSMSTAGSVNNVIAGPQVMVNKVNSVGKDPFTINKDKDRDRGRERVSCVPSRVIVLASAASTSGSQGSVVQARVPSENEALAASGRNMRHESIAAAPRPERDPLLVLGQPTCIPNTVSYACDSSIKNKVPLAEESVGDDFNSVPMDIDSNEEILTELRPQVQEKCSGEVGIELDDNEIIRSESHMDNIFATENADVVFDMLSGGLQVPNIDLDSSPRCGEEGAEPDSPEMETFDIFERHSLNDMMNLFQNFKGDYSQYGGKRRDCLYRNPMLSPGIYKGSQPGQPFMEDDEDRDESDDERESCYELNSQNLYVHSKRPRISGGKVGFNGAVSSNGYASVGMAEKEVADGSPSSSSIESETALEQSGHSRNSYLTNRNSMYSTPTSRDTSSHPHDGLKTPAPSPVRTPISTPKRTSDVNMMRYYTSTLDQVRNESEEDRVESRPPVVGKERRGISPDSPGGGFPDVVLDAHKASGQREKETSKRGMLQVTNNTRGKLFRPYIEGLYRSIMPPSIPYPTLPTQIPAGQYCTCSQCYANQLLFLSKYNPTPVEAAPRYGVPMQYRNPNIATDAEKLKKSAEKLKSEDEELLRRIEESLSETKLKSEVTVLDSGTESKYKPDLDTSLPLKKRLKTLVHIDENKVKVETQVKSETVDSTKTESFPSYPTRPMISIAELEINKSVLTKQIPRPIKSPPSNSQRYVQYNNENSYYQPQMQSRDMNGKTQNDLVNQYRSYSSNVTGIPGSEGSSRGLPSFGEAAVTDTGQSENLQVEFPQVQPVSSSEAYCPKENERVEENTVNHSIVSANTSEYSGRQFKTPAQLKEIPINDQYYGAPMLIRPALSMTPSQVDASVAAYVTVPREEDCCSQYNKVHVLDLSVEYPKSSKSTKSQRKKKSGGSEGRTRTSKRSRSLIQNADTVDDFMRSFEKKRRRKHVSR